MGGPSLLPSSKACSRRPSRSRMVASPALLVEFVIVLLSDKNRRFLISETVVAYQSIHEKALVGKRL
jgi:hypothetical protein